MSEQEERQLKQTEEVKEEVNYLELAKYFKTEGKVTEVINTLQTAIDLNPQQPDWVYEELGNAYTQADQLDAAITTYQQGISLNPDQSNLSGFLARLQTENGDLKGAITSYKQAIEIEQNQPDWVYTNLVELLKQQNNLAEAMSAYREGVKLKPELGNRLFEELGRFIVKHRELTDIRAFFAEIIKTQPDNAWHYFNLANAFGGAKGKINKAIEYYYQAIEIQPNLIPAHSKLSRMLAKKGQISEAINCLIKAIQTNSGIEFHQKFWDKIKGYFPKMSSEQLSLLAAAYQYELSQLPDSQHTEIFRYLTYLAKIYTHQGNFSEAIATHTDASYHNLLIHKPELSNYILDNNGHNKPDFLVIGFMKCGTTAVYSYLTQHPQVLPSIKKEINFFGKFLRKEVPMEWYLSQFPPQPQEGKFLTGEASHTYVRMPGVEKSVLEHLPDTKLIIMLRNPVDRVISHYYHRVRNGSETLSFEEVITSELDTYENMPITEVIDKFTIGSRYIPQSLYFYFLEKWMNVFPQEQFLILMSEDLKKQPSQTMNRVFDFLELPDYELETTEVYRNRKSGYYSPVDHDLRLRLSNFFHPHNQKIEQYLNLELNWN